MQIFKRMALIIAAAGVTFGLIVISIVVYQYTVRTRNPMLVTVSYSNSSRLTIVPQRYTRISALAVQKLLGEAPKCGFMSP